MCVWTPTASCYVTHGHGNLRSFVGSGHNALTSQNSKCAQHWPQYANALGHRLVFVHVLCSSFARASQSPFELCSFEQTASRVHKHDRLRDMDQSPSTNEETFDQHTSNGFVMKELTGVGLQTHSVDGNFCCKNVVIFQQLARRCPAQSCRFWRALAYHGSADFAATPVDRGRILCSHQFALP